MTSPALDAAPRDRRDVALEKARKTLALIREHGELTLIEISPSFDVEQAYSRGAHDAFGRMADLAERALADMEKLLR
jgi:predicted HTH domain antitoxin